MSELSRVKALIKRYEKKGFGVNVDYKTLKDYELEVITPQYIRKNLFLKETGEKVPYVKGKTANDILLSLYGTSTPTDKQTKNPSITELIALNVKEALLEYKDLTTTMGTFNSAEFDGMNKAIMIALQDIEHGKGGVHPTDIKHLRGKDLITFLLNYYDEVNN